MRRSITYGDRDDAAVRPGGAQSGGWDLERIGMPHAVVPPRRAEQLERLERAFALPLSEHLFFATAKTPRDRLRAMHGAAPVAPVVATPSTRQAFERVATLPTHSRTLVDVLEWHAQSHPQRLHLSLDDEAGQGEDITFAALYQEATTVAAGLRRQPVPFQCPSTHRCTPSVWGPSWWQHRPGCQLYPWHCTAPVLSWDRDKGCRVGEPYASLLASHWHGAARTGPRLSCCGMGLVLPSCGRAVNPLWSPPQNT